MANPSYEVVIAAYNAEAYLAEAIQSVLNSSIPPLRIWVVDDASTDRTREIARQFGSVQLLRNEKNQERSYSRNLALARIEADFVQILDADDLIHPDKIELQLELFEAYPETDVVFGDVQMFEQSFRKENLQDLRTYEDVDILEQLIRKNTFAIHSFLFRRSFFETFGLFREDMNIGEDRELYIRSILQGAKYRYSPSALCYYRMHGEGTIKSRQFEAAYYNAMAIRIHREGLSAYQDGKYRSVTGESLRTLARNATIHKRPFEEVKELLKEADACKPYPGIPQKRIYDWIENLIGAAGLEWLLRLKP